MISLNKYDFQLHQLTLMHHTRNCPANVYLTTFEPLALATGPTLTTFSVKSPRLAPSAQINVTEPSAR